MHPRRPWSVGFQSTPSARRATTDVAGTDKKTTISIHALREEGDFTAQQVQQMLSLISIHALREEGDLMNSLNFGENKPFQSTPSARRATH